MASPSLTERFFDYLETIRGEAPLPGGSAQKLLEKLIPEAEKRTPCCPTSAFTTPSMPTKTLSKNIKRRKRRKQRELLEAIDRLNHKRNLARKIIEEGPTILERFDGRQEGEEGVIGRRTIKWGFSAG